MTTLETLLWWLLTLLMCGGLVFAATEVVRAGVKLTRLAPKATDFVLRSTAAFIGGGFGFFLVLTPEPVHWGFGVSAGALGAATASWLVATAFKGLVQGARDAVIGRLKGPPREGE